MLDCHAANIDETAVFIFQRRLKSSSDIKNNKGRELTLSAMYKSKIKVVAFDADDTLWINEPYFQETEQKFCSLLEDYASRHNISQELFKTEIANLTTYGYGVKGYILSMIEAAVKISGKTLSLEAIEKIIEFGKDMLSRPVELIEGIEEILQTLQPHYKLVVATKGDLLDQENKLKRSGLEKYFHHIEVMTEKNEEEYQKLVRHLDIQPNEFLMVGNSLKSDVLPVLAIGGHAAHVPFHTIWAHEKVDHEINHQQFQQFKKAIELLTHL
jgi:putative hydrolase of the HAD superfamily